MPGRMEFEFQSRSSFARPVETDPFRILVIGDFSGRNNRGVLDPLAGRRAYPVDVDSFDALFGRFAPRLKLAIGEIGFDDLDAFHPDGLYDRLDVFKELKSTRRRLLDPATFAQAAAELKQGAASLQQVSPATDDEGGAAPEEGDASALERLLGRAPEDAPPQPRVAGKGLDEIIHGIVAPFIVPEVDPSQDLYVASVDEAIAAEMRAVLHDPGFRSLEAAWLGLHGLVTGSETGEELVIRVLDASRAEVDADLAAAGGDLESSHLYKTVMESGPGSPGGKPWSLIAADFTFGPGDADVRTLASLGAVASQAGGPVLAGGSPALLGVESIAAAHEAADWSDPASEAWAALRGSGLAEWIGIALPSVLARLPYGSVTDEIDRFPFEEIKGSPEDGLFSWGNPAFVCARLMAAAFTERGWSMQPGDILDLGDLPAYSYKEDGESRLWPCARAPISERGGEAIVSRGLIPLLSYKNRNAVRVMRFQSIATPPRELAGPWR